MADSSSFLENWTRLFSGLQSFLEGAQSSQYPTYHYCEYVLDRTEMFITSISQLVTHFNSSHANDVVQQYVGHLNELLHHLRIILTIWNENISQVQGLRSHDHPFSYMVPSSSGATGRPKYVISREQLLYLRSMRFTWVEISQLIGVSTSTVYRRRMELGIDIDASVGRSLNDSDLLEIVRNMRLNQPALGQTMLWAHLKADGYHVTRARVRNAIRTTDPLATVLNWSEMTSRRPYSVPSPNSLWHLGERLVWVHISTCYCMHYCILIL